MSRDSEEPAAPHRVVPSLYVDAAEIRPQPYTVQVLLSSTAPDGSHEPRVHLAMSPNFAMHLYETLGRALAAYTTEAGAGGAQSEPDESSRKPPTEEQWAKLGNKPSGADG